MQTANNKQVNKMKNFVFTNMLKCAAVILSSFLAVNAYGQEKAETKDIIVIAQHSHIEGVGIELTTLQVKNDSIVYKGSYTEGNSIVLTVVPDARYAFYQWSYKSDNNQDSTIFDNPRTEIPSTDTITAMCGYVYYEEDFETYGDNLPLPTEETDNIWRQQYVVGSFKWKLANGGGKPTTSPVRKPETAQSESHNALFFKLTIANNESTRLVSPTIDIKNTNKPMLTFWYSQYKSEMGDTKDNFEFTLCYRLSSSSKWVEYRTFSTATDDMTPWRKESIYLPDSCKQQEFQIAFLSTTKKVGYGVCIDNIKIIETLTMQKYVSSIFASQPNTNMIPTSATDNPVMMLKIPVLGNDGVLFLNSITATALQQAETSVTNNGMKLYYTTSDEFKTDSLLARASIVNGKATFNNIDFDLPLGNSYLWIACDVKDEDGNHTLKNSIIDFKIEANAIDIGGSKYPKSDLPANPGQGRLVIESRFFDNFENPDSTNKYWSFTGDFERAAALGHGGSGGGGGGNPDPDYARSGSNIIGTDITGDGNYESSEDYRSTATTIPFDCYFYKDINVLFYRWLNCSGVSDYAFVRYSLSEGDTLNAWQNSSSIQEHSWSFQKYSIGKNANRNRNLSLQIKLGPTLNNNRYSGWNIDDFALVGTFVYADAAITHILAPNSGCGLSNEEDVTIKIKNTGYNKIEIPFTVSYSIDGGKTWVDETIDRAVERNEEFEYTFQTKADLSSYSRYDSKKKDDIFYDIRTKVTLAEDEYEPNNTMQKKVLSRPTYSLPYAEDFDNDYGGYWYRFGDNKTWKTATLSDVPCWTTSADWEAEYGYKRNDSAWLETPCFDFSNVQKPMLSFKLKCDAEDTDGLTVYYSTDNGASWTLIPYGTNYERLNWYNTEDPIDALGTAGWTGYEPGWTFIQQLLPGNLAGKSSVKLKFLFQSVDNEDPTDKYAYNYGFAIADVRLYEAPADAGVAAIVSPVSACHLDSLQQITVSIHNYGIRGLTSADSLFATVNINNRLTLVDTFLLDAGDTIKVGMDKEFTFTQKVNMWNKKNYIMTAYTDVIGDTLLFEALDVTTSNDTTRSTASVWGEPAYSLGPDKGMLHPESSITGIDGGLKSDGTVFNAYQWKPWKDSTGILIDTAKTLYPTVHESNQRWMGVKAGEELPAFPEGKTIGYYYEYTIAVKTITDGHECWEHDTIRIIKSETNISIDTVTFKFISENNEVTTEQFIRNDEDEFGAKSTQYCISKQPDAVILSVKNVAGVPVDNEKITLCYTYFDADTNLYTYSEDTLGVLLQPKESESGNTFCYAFKKLPNLALDGIQDLHFFVRINADMNHSNDSATIKVNVWPLPTADLGPDSIPAIDPENDISMLQTDEISGATYKWQYKDADDNWLTILENTQWTETVGEDSLVHTNKFDITEKRTTYYQITVADEHACGIATDSILIISDNWKLEEIISPADQCEPNEEAYLTVAITNNSLYDYPAGYTIPIAITINGEARNEVIELESALESGATDTTTFNTPIDMSEIGEYRLSVSLNPTHDINRNDNFKRPAVNIWGIKEVDFGDRFIYTLEPDTVVLDAGDGFKTYDWGWYPLEDDIEDTVYVYYEDGVTPCNSQTFQVTYPREVTYIVFVTEEHGCITPELAAHGDSVTIMPYDLEIKDEYISSPVSSCEINNNRIATFSLKNKGQDITETNYEGEKRRVKIYMQADGGEVISNTIELKGGISSGANKEFSLPFTANFDESLTVHEFKMWLSWEGDNFHDNDTASIQIEQLPHPDDFSLGDDIYTTRPDTVRLAAPEGYRNYIWSDNSTESKFRISYSGSAKYWVDVKNEFGCTTTDTISIFTTDLTMNMLAGTTHSCSPVSSDSVKAQIMVNQNNTVPAGAQFTATFECNGYTGTKEIVTTKDITPDEPYTFSFDNLVTLPDTGDYTLKTTLTVHNSIDVDRNNNAVTSTVRVGAIQLPFNDTIRTYDDIYIIDAGTNFTTFSWVDNPFADQRIAVVTEGKYTVNVVDTNGCVNTDSTYIIFVKPAYEIDRLGFASTMCAPDELTGISLYVKNIGNDIVAAGTVIPVSYKIDDNATVEENFTLTKNLRENDSLLIQFNTKADVRETGSYTMMLNADVNGYETSSLKTITVMENPSPDLGEDINTDKDSWQLTPGINFGQFLWSTGETNYYIDVTTSGDYWVTVTNNYGCSANDTVSVHFTEPEVSVAAFNSAAAYCGDIIDQNFEINLSNSGVKNVAAGHTIGITCAVGDTTVSDSITLPNDFFAGASFNHKLAAPVSIKGVGAHTLAFTVSIDGKQTDISAFTVNIYDFPTFQFANDELVVDEYPYTLTAPVANAGYLWSDGSTESSISVSEDGTYSLTVTDANNCSASSSINIKLKIIDNPGGGGGNGGGGTTPPPSAINSLAEGEIGIYPNPADNTINIDFSQSQLTGSRIWIMSVTGKVLMTDIQTSDIMRIDISNWPQGIYIIKVMNGGSSGFIKFVKR